MNSPRWTDDDLTLAWHTGRDYQQNRLDEAADDIAHTTSRMPTVTYEQRVALRHHEMLRSIAPDEYLGGPVDWNAARALPPAIAANAQRNRDHDRNILDRAAGTRPAYADNDWAAVQQAVSATVWWRIWWDLADTTRNRFEHLAPASALRLGGEPE